MRASTFMGGVTVLILILSAVVSVLILAYPLMLFPETEKPKETFEYVMLRGEAPEVESVLINLKVENGAVKLSFAEDENLTYKITFKYGVGGSKPTVNQTIAGSLLAVSAQLKNGEAKVVLGSGYLYDLNILLMAGGFSAILDGNCHIRNLRVAILSGGGVVNLRSGFEVENANIVVDSGGLILNVNVGSLSRSSNLYVNVSRGGIIIPPIKVGSGVGFRVEAKAASGGITLDSPGLKVIEQTSTSCIAQTFGYELAKAKINLKVEVLNGGAIINKRFLPGFTPFRALTVFR